MNDEFNQEKWNSYGAIAALVISIFSLGFAVYELVPMIVASFGGG